MVIKLRFSGKSGGHRELSWRVRGDVRGGKGSRRKRVTGDTNARNGVVVELEGELVLVFQGNDHR